MCSISFKSFFSSMALAGMVMMGSCSDDLEKGKELNLSTETRATASQLESFYIDFAKDAFKFMDENREEGMRRPDAVVSPLSASFALGVFANGVDADVQSKLVKYLGVDDIYGLNEFSKTLIAGLPSVDGKTDVKIANAVWASEKLTLSSDFSDAVRNGYNASLQYVNFLDAEKARVNINNWISSATKKKINEFLSVLSPETYFVVANAIYFESQWADEYFKESNTKKAPFYVLDDESEEPVTKVVDMMHSKTMTASYTADDDFEFVSIPFGNNSFSINLLLPNSELKFDEAVNRLNKDKYETLMSMSRDKELTVVMPKLEIETEIDLCKVLEYAGVADLQMSQFSLFNEEIENVSIMARQGSNFKLDEEGAKVATATVVSGWFGANLTESLTVNLNRPFLFFITEKTTNACILAGRVLGS